MIYAKKVWVEYVRDKSDKIIKVHINLIAIDISSELAERQLHVHMWLPVLIISNY